MATIESPEKVGLKPAHEFDQAQRDLAAGGPARRDPRGRLGVPRPLRRPGEPDPAASAPSTSPPPGTRSSSPSAAPPRRVNPFINILNRLVVVQYEDFEGDRQDPGLRADRDRGPGRGALLRPAAQPLRRVPLLQGLRHLLQRRAAGDGEDGGSARGRRLHQLRPPPRPGHPLRARLDRAAAGPRAARCRRCSRTRS